MNQSKPRVILTRKLPETVETRMRELFSASLNETDIALSRAQLEVARLPLPREHLTLDIEQARAGG